MKIRAITLSNVRRFTSPVRVGEIGDGLNVLCEPNESGKSTLFDALQALFFRPHRSSGADIKGLRPHAGGAPEVTVEVETADGRFTIFKRWLSRPDARVQQGGRLVAQADAAEAWISALLGERGGGPSGLVWVRQGVTRLDQGEKGELEAALSARRDLMSSVAGEVEAVTGGRRMDDALARCRDELAAYATAGGKPRAGGPWKAAEDRVRSLTETRDGLERIRTELRDALDQRGRKRRDLAALEDPEAASARQSRLDAATEAHRLAERHADELDEQARRVDAARLAVTATNGRLEALRNALAERRAAEIEAGDTATAAGLAREALDQAQKESDTADAALAAHCATRDAARDAHRRAERRAAAREGAARRRELLERIAQAEAARTAMEDSAGPASQGPDAAALQNLERLATTAEQAAIHRDAAAPQLVLRLEPRRQGAVRLDGVLLEGDRSTPILRRTVLSVEGVGELEISPGPGGGDEAQVAAAQARLRKALDALGASDLAAARLAADLRAQAVARHAQASAVLESLAPNGIEALRKALNQIPESAAADGDGPDLPEAAAALATAEEAAMAAHARREAATQRLTRALSAAARAEAAETAARARLTRAAEAADRLGDDGAATEAALARQLAAEAALLTAAETLHAEKARAAPDLAAARAALTRARSVSDEAREEIVRLRTDLARLDERIAQFSGDGVGERLAETEAALAAAEADLARMTREVRVLQRLQTALEAARTEARERYFAPVAAELKPLLHLLWPEAELTWGQERLLPAALIRNGQTEPIEILSGGTNEQIALMVRLAFARMLARSGRHAPVILDDALVFTDDDRIERMFDALHRQAGDLQIIVLSCRQRVFRDLGGRCLRLAGAGDAADEDAA